MAYDERLAERVRKALGETRGLIERRMFGGLCFEMDGHMCCGILGQELVVRIGPLGYDLALRRPHTRPMDFTGKPLRGFVYVSSAGLKDLRSIRRWVGEGVRYASSLPRKRKARGEKDRSGR